MTPARGPARMGPGASRPGGRRAARPPIFTVGHSTRPIGRFLRLLAAHDIDWLIDVRRFPWSPHNPQFGKDELVPALRRAGIRYRHLPGLGGRRAPRPDSPNTGWRNRSFRGYADYMATAAFGRSLDRCLRLGDGARIALMCAEGVPWRCHRSLIADALVARGYEVCEITSGVRAVRHTLTAGARVDPTGLTYPARP